MLDPVRDRCIDPATISTSAADAIVDLVRGHGYTVDYILETHATSSQCLSAAWYLRMQFSNLQGWPPQLCNEATVTGLEAMWQRKYGANNKFSTSIRAGLDDGESVTFGWLSLTCIHLPGFATLHRRAYVVGKDVFGAHSVAALTDDPSNIDPKDASESHIEESERHLDAWTSINRILSLPSDTRVWRATGDDCAIEQTRTFDLVSQCTALNKYSGMSKADFLTGRMAETQSLRDQEQRPPSYRVVGLRSRLESWIRA